MAEMKSIKYKESDERLMVGMFREASFSNAGQVWQDFYQGDSIEKLEKLSDVKCCDDIDENDGIGFMYDFSDKQNFNIIIGDFVQANSKIPDGLFAKYIPKGLINYFQISSLINCLMGLPMKIFL